MVSASSAKWGAIQGSRKRALPESKYKIREEKKMKKKIRSNANLLIIIGVILVVSSVIGSATSTFTSSTNVLVINGNAGFTGPINSSDFTIGGPFYAGIATMNQINVVSFSSVGSNDTVVLFQINTSTLTAAQRTTLVSFVTGGGKLLIWDSDGGASPGVPNDYNWLPANLDFNTSVPGQLGALGGILTVTEENDLSSSNPLNTKFINTTLLVNFTDAVGDANIVATNGTDWCQDMFGQNAATPPQSGPAHMYSRLNASAGNGFIVYSALDWNYAGFNIVPGGNELKKMLQFELMVSHTSNLPCKAPVVAPKGSISGMKFNDLDGNGIKDMGEIGLAKWTITLTNQTGGTITTMTDASGNYSFTNLSDGNYTVGEVLKLGWMQTAPPTGTYSVTITSGTVIADLDFGNKRLPPKALCIETVNPAGKNVPPAGSTTLPGPKGGQNEDGFYQLLGMDILDPSPQVFVNDTGSGTIFGPFANGTRIKYTEANGATPNQKSIGGPNSAVAWHITGTGDAAVYAVNNANIKSAEVLCKVPPPPK